VPHPLATAIFTGLRSDEIVGLRSTDVDVDPDVIRVRRLVDTRRAGACQR